MNNVKCIFYFAYFGSENEIDDVIQSRADYIEKQLLFLSKKCDENNVNMRFIVATIPERLYSTLLHIAKKYDFLIYSKYIQQVNNYEHNGILSCIEFAKKNPDTLIFYCHSKGSANNNELSMGIFKYHVQINLSWDLTYLLMNDDLYKAGLFPSKGGWLWHNFFWVKSSYLRNKTLKPDGTRHYYESFIGDKGLSQAYTHVVSTLPRDFFNVQDELTKNDFYEAYSINKCGFLNREFRRLGKDME
ncbi:hypothetical protein [Aeromonas veronii]